MPVDPRHQRRVPSGRRLARVLAALLRAMRGEAVQAVLHRREPDFGKYRPALARAVLPIVLHEYALGHEAGRRGAKARGKRVRRLHTKDAATTLPGVAFDLLREGVPAAVQRLVLALVGHVTESLRQDVRDAVREGLEAGESLTQTADRMDDVFGPRRAYTIAATESSRAMHSAEEEAAKEAGAAGLEWMASSDACAEVCEKLNGKRVRFGEPFMVHATGRAEYRAVYHPPAHPRCMCSCTPFWEDD